MQANGFRVSQVDDYRTSRQAYRWESWSKSAEYEEYEMRQPLTVLVFPFRLVAGRPEYAIFRRADDASWQSVSGGVEGSETLTQTARRETAEETGLSGTQPLYKLDMLSGVEKECFAASKHWPADLYVVAKHFFAMDLTDSDQGVKLSDEHHEFRWMAYGEAYAALRYDDDKTALWELNARIGHDDLPGPKE
jgi:dATP pyrophosphohydrolase